MKTISLSRQLNKIEKSIIDTIKRAYKNEQDIVDHIGMVKKEFIKLRKQLEDCIIIKQPVKSYWQENKRLEDIK